MHCKACKLRHPAADGTIPSPPGVRADGSARCHAAACVRFMFGKTYLALVCLFAYLLATLRKNFPIDLCELFMEGS